MGNSLGTDLKGMRAVVDARYLAEEYGEEATRTVDCLAGFGCSPSTGGNAVLARFPDGVVRRVEGFMFERLVGPTPEGEREMEYAVTLIDADGSVARDLGRVWAETDTEAARKAMEAAGITEPGGEMAFDIFTGAAVAREGDERYAVRAVRAGS